MQDPNICISPVSQPDPEPVQRLLAALGEWGVAEVQGASERSLELLIERAMSAYTEVASAA